MNEPVNVTRAALVKLLDAVPYPNPDDPGDPSPPWWGPYGPIGPVIGGVLRGLSWVLLNPQPLPPRDISALQKVLGRSRASTSSRREEVVYGNAGRLGFGVLLILVMISLSVWLLRRRTREEIAPAVPVAPEEEAVLLEEEGVVPPGAPRAEDDALREDPPPGEERPERRGITPTTPPTPREEPPPGEERPGRRR